MNNKDEEIKTKQVVIRGLNNFRALLTPYWILEYYKRKGIKIYCYIEEDFDGNIYLCPQEKVKDLDDSKYNCEYFSPKLITDNIKEEFNKLNESELFGIYDFEERVNRDDPILIQIAKEINDPKLVKIVEIPADVEYEICESCESCSEYICEKHRTWK